MAGVRDAAAGASASRGRGSRREISRQGDDCRTDEAGTHGINQHRRDVQEALEHAEYAGLSLERRFPRPDSWLDEHGGSRFALDGMASARTRGYFERCALARGALACKWRSRVATGRVARSLGEMGADQHGSGTAGPSNTNAVLVWARKSGSVFRSDDRFAGHQRSVRIRTHARRELWGGDGAAKRQRRRQIPGRTVTSIR